MKLTREEKILMAKGYYLDKKQNKFISKIMVFGKNISLGRHDKEEDARATYLMTTNY